MRPKARDFLQKWFNVIKSLHIGRFLFAYRAFFTYQLNNLMIKLILSCFLFSASYSTIAATVLPTLPTNSSIQFLDQKQQTTHYSTHPLHKTDNNTEASIFLNTSAQIENASQSDTSLKSFAKQFNNKYTDNELFQKSLASLYETKQLWDIADSQANTYANELIFNLKLEQFTENNSTNTQQALPSYNNDYYSKKINSSYQEHQNSQLSDYQIQQAYTNSSTQDISKLSHNYIASLFQTSTLYYLIAIYIFFILLIWAIKFTLRLFP